MSFYELFFCSIGHADIVWSTVSSNCWQSLHLLSVFVFNIFVTQYFICSAWSRAATISLSVSAFRSPFDSHRNVSSSLISCLPIFLMYCPYITFFSIYSLGTLPMLPLCVVFHPVLRHAFHLVDFIIIIIIIIQYVCLLSQAFLPGTSLEPAVIPTTQASSFTLQYFPYCV